MLSLLKSLFGSGQPSNQLLADASRRFVQMLDQAAALLAKAEPWLLDKATPDQVLQEARAIDKSSNRTEREIRKLLIEALAFQHSDAPLGLVLMSVAKDGERLIDECRNLLDLSGLVEEALPGEYVALLREQARCLTEAISQTRQVFADNDEKRAIAIVEGEKPYIAALHTIDDRILADAALTGRQAVLLSRGFRFLQRIRAHLGNIASTVIFPVHQIDFAKKKYLDEARDRLER